MPRGEWEAPVAGVFGKAVALAHPDGLWVTILRFPDDLEARGLWPGGGAFEALAAAAREGKNVRYREGDGCRLSANGFAVDLPPRKDWDPRPLLRKASARFSSSIPEGRRAAVQRVKTALGSDGEADGIHGRGPFAARFLELCREPGFPFNLVGFGQGTTPAGDDFISGYLAGRILLGDGLPGGTADAGDLSRTTIPGRTLLAGALEGIFPAYMVRLACAVADAAGSDPKVSGDGDLEAAVRQALAHGASSGRDAIWGLLEILSPERSFP